MTTESVATTEKDPSTQMGELLEKYGEISTILPVLVGLLVTSRLGLRGTSALIANVAVAALARQVVVQLRQQAKESASSDGAAAEPSAAPAGAPSRSDASGNKDEEDYTIVHAIPGRIRLRVPQLQTDASYARRLEKVLLADAAVASVRINRLASSLALRYDATAASELDLGMRLLQALERAKCPPDATAIAAET